MKTKLYIAFVCYCDAFMNNTSPDDGDRCRNCCRDRGRFCDHGRFCDRGRYCDCDRYCHTLHGPY